MSSTRVGDDKNFSAKHRLISENVVKIVREHPSTISDYRKLLQYYWYYIDGLKNFVPLDELERITQPESISRAFRKLVEQGVIIMDEKTKMARINEEKKFRSHYRKKKWYSGEDNFTL